MSLWKGLFTLHVLLPLLFFLSIIPAEGNGPKRRLKVLVFSPSLSWSHMTFLGKIADSLAEAGHEVHFVKLLTNAKFASKNETKLVRHIHLIRPKLVKEEQLEMAQMVGMMQEPFKGIHFYTLKALEDRSFVQLFEFFQTLCREILHNPELLQKLSQTRFDVAITELFDACPYGLFHRLGVPTKLAIMALPWFPHTARRFGIPTFSSFVPTLSAPINAPKMGFFERTANFLNDFYEWAFELGNMKRMEEASLRGAFGPDFPSAAEIARNVSLFFVNSDPFLEFARPISHKVVSIGGIMAEEEEQGGELDQEVKAILDASKQGAVLVSFGSIADTRKMSGQMLRGMLGAFGRFPDWHFIWKLDRNSRHNHSALFASAPNVHTFEWVQQRAILRHPKLRAFVSHTGQNSLSEAARAGVPLLAVPLFSDQLYNAVLAKHKGMAVFLEVRELNGEKAEAKMFHALEELLLNPFYKSNAQLVARKLALSPFSAKEKLIKWVEFAAEFPELNELNLPDDEEMHWFVYYSLDAIAFTGLLLLALLSIGAFGIAKALALALVWRGALGGRRRSGESIRQKSD